MSKTYRTKFRKGFTLIELLVVISIISLLASVVMASLNGARAKARDAQRKATLQQLSTAVEMYYNNNGSYPQTTGWFSNPNHGGLDSALTPTYISKVSDDPQFSVTVHDYSYMRKDYTGDGEPVISGGQDKYAFYANLENPTAADTATMSDAYDI